MFGIYQLTSSVLLSIHQSTSIVQHLLINFKQLYFPKRWTSKICIESLRVFFAADNLYFTSAHTGFDPRTAYTGQNAFGFPQAKTFTFGITMNL